jgi:hypothetical protein
MNIPKHNIPKRTIPTFLAVAAGLTHEQILDKLSVTYFKQLKDLNLIVCEQDGITDKGAIKWRVGLTFKGQMVAVLIRAEKGEYEHS